MIIVKAVAFAICFMAVAGSIILFVTVISALLMPVLVFLFLVFVFVIVFTDEKPKE